MSPPHQIASAPTFTNHKVLCFNCGVLFFTQAWRIWRAANLFRAMNRELRPETPKLFCINQLLDQSYFNRRLRWVDRLAFPNYHTKYQ